MSKLDTCWKNCLRMWKWIAENYTDGDEVCELKDQWLRDNGFRKVALNCFFCHYDRDERIAGERICKHCPGVLVDSKFHCNDIAYDYTYSPNEFYAKLLQLNAKRLKAGGQ